jgi:hypothetical protein
MKDETKTVVLRALCWIFVVILPAGIICWLAEIHNVGMVAVAVPFILVAERVYRRLLRRYGLWGVRTGSASSHMKGIEPGAAPNDGPAGPLGNSGVSKGPPSMS